MLPPPNVFAAYPPEVQQRMMAWQDAQVIGESERLAKVTASESARQDVLATSTVLVARRGQWLAGGLYALSLGGAVALAWRGNNTGAAIALAPGVLVLLGRFLPTPTGRHDDPPT